MTLPEISSSTVFERSNVSGPSSWHVWFADVPSEDLHHNTGRGGVRQMVVFGSTAPGTSGRPGIGVFLHGGEKPCSVGLLVDVGEANLGKSENAVPDPGWTLARWPRTSRSG